MRLLVLFLFVLVFINSDIIVSTFIDTSIVFSNTLLPNLFILFLFTDLLSSQEVEKLFDNKIGHTFKKIFGFKSIIQPFILFISLIAGIPSTSKLIRSYIDDGKITSKQAKHLLLISAYVNPLYIINGIGIYIYGSKIIGTQIFLISVISNILIGLTLRFKYSGDNLDVNEIAEIKPEKKKNPSILLVFIESTKKNSIIILNIFSIIAVFTILFEVINHSLNNILDPIYPFFEITYGIFRVANLDLPLALELALITMYVSFAGISVHIQIYYILDDKELYKSFLTGRLIQALLSFLIAFIFFSLSSIPIATASIVPSITEFDITLLLFVLLNIVLYAKILLTD